MSLHSSFNVGYELCRTPLKTFMMKNKDLLHKMIAGKEQHTIRKSGKNGETPQKDKPFLYISEKCPEDIKAELLKDWEKIKVQTIERHKQGCNHNN